MQTNAANLLTGLRVVLTPLFVVAVLESQQSVLWGALAVLQFAAAAASDVWDGRLARQHGTATSGGRWFDHFADIGFILPALAVYVYLGELPWWVPGSVALAFGVYLIESSRAAPTAVPHPWGRRIGHIGGICNYVLIGVLACNNSLGLQWLPPWFLYTLFLLVPLYSFAALAVRLLPQPSRV